MKKLITSNISGVVKQPIRKITLDHLQEAHQECLDSIVKAFSGNPAIPSILHGCVNSGSGANYIISAGAIYFNGEVYLCDAATFSLTGSDVAVGVLDITYPASDPTTFTDGNSYNVHSIRKVKWEAGATGSGIGTDFEEITKLLSDITTSANNGQTVSVDIVSAAPFTYGSLVTKYSYRVLGKKISLAFKVSFEVTDGAVVSAIKIPLPQGIVKNTTLNTDFSGRGFAALIAPLATTNYEILYVNAIDDGSEGQRLVLKRASGGATDITLSTSAIVTLQGQIEFDLA